MKYVVWQEYAKVLNDEGDPAREVVVTRTDRKVAEGDVNILRDICHRKAWIQEEDK